MTFSLCLVPSLFDRVKGIPGAVGGFYVLMTVLAFINLADLLVTIEKVMLKISMSAVTKRRNKENTDHRFCGLRSEKLRILKVAEQFTKITGGDT
jgi:uncharacterized membrane protein